MDNACNGVAGGDSGPSYGPKEGLGGSRSGKEQRGQGAEGSDGL